MKGWELFERQKPEVCEIRAVGCQRALIAGFIPTNHKPYNLTYEKWRACSGLKKQNQTSLKFNLDHGRSHQHPISAFIGITRLNDAILHAAGHSDHRDSWKVDEGD